MKFIVSSATLKDELNALIGIVPKNPMIHVLENFLFDIKKNVLRVTVSDLQITVSTELSVECKEDGRMAIPAQILVDTMRSLPDQSITISFDTESYNIEIVSDNGRYKLSGENPEDFPSPPEVNEGTKKSFSAKLLKEAIQYSLYATSSDELRPAMNGVFVGLNKTCMTFVGTDGHRLVRYENDSVQDDATHAIIIPRKALGWLKSVLPSDGSMDIEMDFNVTNVIFRYHHMEIFCRLVDERFPEYEKVIPEDNTNVITVDREDMLSSLKRMTIYSNQQTRQVRLEVKGSELTLIAENQEYENEAKEVIACEHEGEDIEIGFNTVFLREIFETLDSKRVRMKLKEPNKAGLFLPMEEMEEEEDARRILSLVMPIMLNV